MTDNDRRCCGNCKYHKSEIAPDGYDWYCTNEDADAWTDMTGYDDGEDCQDFENRYER